MNPFLLLGLGFLLIFLEFYLPGAVMGIAGGILVAASIVIFAVQSDSIIHVVLFILAAAAALVVLIRFALWRIVHTKKEYSIYSDDDQKGYYASSYDKTTIGKEAVVLTDLKPGGHVVIEGKTHQAISVSGYLTKGDHVKVIGGQEESLLVQSMRKENI